MTDDDATADGSDVTDDLASAAGGSDPADTFALVGNAIRAEILRTLGEARGQRGARPVLAFAELRRRVDIEVPSSQFNYHLQRLVGTFLERTDDGYRMRPEGTTLYRTVRSGTLDRDASLGPFDAGFDCHFCAATVEASYEDGLFSMRCPDCGYGYRNSTRVPPGAFADGAELLSRVDTHDRHKLLAFARGVCPTCVNRLESDLVRAGESALPSTEHDEVYVVRSCARCGNQDYRRVGEALLQRPAVVSFFHDRGLDVATTPTWELEFAATDRHVTVRSEDPWAVALGLERHGDRLELVVDGDLTVTERTLTRVAGSSDCDG